MILLGNMEEEYLYIYNIILVVVDNEFRLFGSIWKI